MNTYQVPLSIYPDIYTEKPLMYAALASYKNKKGVANGRQAVIKAMRVGILTPQEICSIKELAELLSYMDTIEAVAPLLKQRLDELQVQS